MVFAAVFLVVGFLPLIRNAPPRFWALATAATLILIAWLKPAVLAVPSRGWAWFGDRLHRVTSPVALGLIYFAGVVPTGLAMRALGKDPLRLRREPAQASYWIPRSPPGPAPESLRNQF
jgi:hypothetical protein